MDGQVDSSRTIAEQLLVRLDESKQDIEASAVALHDIYAQQVKVQISAQGQRLIYSDGSVIIGAHQGNWVLEGSTPWRGSRPVVTMSGWYCQCMKEAERTGAMDIVREFTDLVEQYTPGAKEWLESLDRLATLEKLGSLGIGYKIVESGTSTTYE